MTEEDVIKRAAVVDPLEREHRTGVSATAAELRSATGDWNADLPRPLALDDEDEVDRVVVRTWN